MFIENSIISVDGNKEKIYESDARKKAMDVPKDKSFWQFLIDRLEQQLEVTALEMVDLKGYSISRREFIDRSKAWAKAFYAYGIKKGEVVPFFGLNSPEMAVAAGGLNLIGAVPYFIRPNVSGKAIQREVDDCRVAIVFGPMWNMTDNAFSNYDKVIFITLHDWIKNPLKAIVKIKTRKMMSAIPKGKRFSSVNEFLKKGDSVDYSKIANINHKSDDFALITSSSGTTDKHTNKGIVATNESIIANLLQTSNGEPEFHFGKRCLCELPFAFATIIDVGFLFPLYRGMTIVSCLRANPDHVLENTLKTKANIILCCGSYWDFFFRQVEDSINRGVIPDLSFLEMPIMGGGGTTVAKVQKWLPILKKCGCNLPIFCGYGLSEVFSVISVDTIRVTPEKFEENDIISVGFPMPGVDLAILLENGRVLEHPTPEDRGELLIHCKSMMAGYYKRPEKTKEMFLEVVSEEKNQKIKWLKTGDLAHLDTDGRIYIWGRQEHNLILEDGSRVYTPDIVSKLCKNSPIEDAVVFYENKELLIHLDCKQIDDTVKSHVEKTVYDLGISKDDIKIKMFCYPEGFPLDKASTKTDYKTMQMRK